MHILTSELNCLFDCFFFFALRKPISKPKAIDRKYLMPFFTAQTQYGSSSNPYTKMTKDMEMSNLQSGSNRDANEDAE